MKLFIATQNPGKQTEIRALLSQAVEELLFPQDLNLGEVDIEETGTTLPANAELKARGFAAQTHLASLADDSGLEVEALDGRPGVYSKRLVPGSDADRNKELLRLMTGKKNRAAVFKTVLCLYNPDTNTTQFFEGEVKGKINDAPRGEDGFGYDPLFVPDGYDQTFAELGTDIKNTLSHRARALAKLLKYLQSS